MTKEIMLAEYENYSAADSYILGFVYNKGLYMVEVAEVALDILAVELASRNQGENLRLRIRKAQKEALVENATLIGSADDLVADKYNRGEIFEKLVTEYFGQTWEKDTVPFWVKGDITLGGKEVQIKLDGATMVNSKLLAKLAA